MRKSRKNLSMERAQPDPQMKNSPAQVFAQGPGSLLFYGYGLGQVSGLVYVQIFSNGGIVGDQLQNSRDGEDRKFIRQIRYGDAHVGDIVVQHGALLGKKDDKSPSGFNLPHIEIGLGKDMVLGSDGDNRHVLGDQGNGAVL